LPYHSHYSATGHTEKFPPHFTFTYIILQSFRDIKNKVSVEVTAVFTNKMPTEKWRSKLCLCVKTKKHNFQQLLQPTGTFQSHPQFPEQVSYVTISFRWNITITSGDKFAYPRVGDIFTMGKRLWWWRTH